MTLDREEEVLVLSSVVMLEPLPLFVQAPVSVPELFHKEAGIIKTQSSFPRESWTGFLLASIAALRFGKNHQLYVFDCAFFFSF